MEITTSIQKVFKVLRRKGDGLYSLVPSPWDIKYKPGALTKPKHGSFLYAFTSQEAAHDFVTSGIVLPALVEIEIWEAQARVLNFDWPYCVDATSVDEEVFKYFWGRVLEGFKIGDPFRGYGGPYDIIWPLTCPSVMRCPPDSVWCKWIKLQKLSEKWIKNN